MSEVSPLKKKTSTIKTTADTVVGIFEIIDRLNKKGKEFYHKNFEYSVLITERDPLYFEVNKWLLEVLPDEKHRSLEVGSSQRFNNVVADDNDSDRKPSPLNIRFNESLTRKVDISGHQVNVMVQVPEGPAGDGNMYREIPPKKIIFVTRSHIAQQAVIAMLEEINQNRATSRKAVLKMVGKWQEWMTRSDLPPRTMQSVALPEEQKSRVINDLKTFLDSEAKYNSLAIPYHRSYMFEGPPGTGKTSLVKALANEFNLDLWYVSVADLSAESSLLQLLSQVGPRSLLLLEDIDTMKITHDRDGSEQGKISMSSLLNVLDGVATPHGLITMMTTNFLEKLDPALKRAGRMDMIEKIDYPTMSSISNMYFHFYNKMLPLGKYKGIYVPIEGLATSEVSEIMKRNMYSPKGAAKDIHKLLEELNG